MITWVFNQFSSQKMVAHPKTLINDTERKRKNQEEMEKTKSGIQNTTKSEFYFRTSKLN